jgi:transposase-like protein
LIPSGECKETSASEPLKTSLRQYTYVEYARFADDLLILIDAHKRHDWLMAAVEKRLREELAELQVEINKEKSRIGDLCERIMKRFKSARQAQRFLSIYDQVSNLFHIPYPESVTADFRRA